MPSVLFSYIIYIRAGEPMECVPKMPHGKISLTHGIYCSPNFFFVLPDQCLHRGEYIYIQGDSGGICITLGNDGMSDSKQKSSYEHGSDFERLRSYGHFLIPVRALM